MKPPYCTTSEAATARFFFSLQLYDMFFISTDEMQFVVAFELLVLLKDLEYVCVRAQCFCQMALSRLAVLISGERKLMLINGAYKSD